MNALHQGRQAVLAQRVDPDRDETGRVYLRTIARRLEEHMLRQPASSVHWVSVVDEPNTFGPPSQAWTQGDCLLQVGLVEGNSEGMLIYVHAQPSRYAPAELVPLLRVKVLCGPAMAAQEVLTVWNWLHSQEFAELVAPAPSVTS